MTDPTVARLLARAEVQKTRHNPFRRMREPSLRALEAKFRAASKESPTPKEG